METWSATRARPAPPGRAVVLALAALLVGAVVVVRDGPAGTPSAADLDRVVEAVEQGCGNPAAELDGSTGFALDGTVVSVTAPADSGAPVLVELRVQEWFRGPPLDRTSVRLDHGTVRSLTGPAGVLAPGLRLLVSGRGWGRGEQAPAAAGCGRTRVHDEAAAADWRSDLGPPEPVGPLGPLARYRDAGWVRTGAGGGPGLTGVLLLDRGCLYVDDGLTRWVPVLPAASSAWLDDPPQLSIGGDVTDVGHPVRLGGLPAGGLPQPGSLPVEEAGAGAVRLDEGGVPSGCRDDAPRFVAADPPAQGPAAVLSVSGEDPMVQAVLDAARTAGAGPTGVAGEVRRDQFGAASVRVALDTERAGEVLVHVENVSFRAWPSGYAPSDATFRWSLEPGQAARLPRPAPGTQLAVVERADGTTQVLVRTADRVVVSASADPTTAVGPPLSGRPLLDALAAIATGVAVGGREPAPAG